MPAIMIVAFIIMYVLRIARLVIFTSLPRCTRKNFLAKGPSENTGVRWFGSLYGNSINRNCDTIAGLLSALKKLDENLALWIARRIRTNKIFYSGKVFCYRTTVWLLPDGSLFQEEKVGEKIYPTYACWSIQGKPYLVNVRD